jgi:putative ABC transport system permease protein
VNLRGIAFSNLRRRKARAAFLVAGLVIGIGTVVTLLTLSAALRVQAQDDLESFGANIVVVPRTDDLSLSYGGVALGGVTTDAREIREADLARIRTIPNKDNIAVVSPELLGVVRADGRRTLIMGVHPEQEFKLKQWWSVDGRPPRGADEVVVGATVAKALSLSVGGPLTIDGRGFTVSGILRPTGSQDDELIVADLAATQSMLHKPGEVTMVQVAALCSNCPVDMMAEQLSAALPGTKVTVMQQVVKSRLHALDQFRTFSYVVAGVIVGIEALVVFVTMMGSVNARTREIGVFRALGFRRGHVTVLILIEATVASVIGGLAGYLAGMGVSYAALPLVASGSGVAIPWIPFLAAAAVGISLVVGSAASLYPALHASRLDPTVALRAL